jgi:hypothetical protein
MAEEPASPDAVGASGFVRGASPALERSEYGGRDRAIPHRRSGPSRWPLSRVDPHQPFVGS